ncbi:MAG: hypothetical protein C4308_00970 [Chitinophagaceae bacterium]
MKISTAIFTLFFYTLAFAQNYYRDIVGTNELNELYRQYKANKVRTVTATGFDAEGRKTNEFSEVRRFYPEKNTLLISTVNGDSKTNQYYQFNSADLITSVTDTTSGVITTTTYSYTATSQLAAIKTIAKDADTVYVNEQHIWTYKNNTPEKMLRILNGVDTTEFRFTIDENGNVIEEQPFRRGNAGEMIYYYYNDENRLTDIVRFNQKAHRLLPDVMFEYNDKGLLRQKLTTITTIGVGYLLWTYAYNENGLKTKEASFNRNKEMMGKIEYSYEFGQ